MLRFAWLPAAFGVVLLTALVGAQGGGSAVQGRVIDAQQAVLPGVADRRDHQENGTFRETISSPDGAYFVPGLPPGRYRIAADLAGFKKFVREDVTLLLGSTQTLKSTARGRRCCGNSDRDRRGAGRRFDLGSRRRKRGLARAPGSAVTDPQFHFVCRHGARCSAEPER